MTDLLLESSIAKLSLKPGDALVLKTKRRLVSEQAERLREQLAAITDRYGAIAIVLDSDMEFEVLTKAAE